MKILNFAIFILLIQFTAMAQENEERWEKNVRVKLRDPMLESFPSGTAKYRLNNKTYIAKAVEGVNYLMFDSVPYGDGTIELRATGYESQSYKIPLIRNKTYNFYLGKPGSAYWIANGFQFPYKKRPGVYGMFADFKQIDSIDSFLDSLGLTETEVQKYVDFNFIQIRTSKKVNSASFIFDLLEHPGIRRAGEVYGQQSVTGFFPTRISIKFVRGVGREATKILKDNGLIIITERGSTYHCRITRESKGTVNEVASRLLKLEQVSYVGVQIVNYRPPPTTLH